MKRYERSETTQKAPRGLEGRLMRHHTVLESAGPQGASDGLSDDLVAAAQQIGNLTMLEGQTMACVDEIQMILAETDERSLAQMQDALGRIESACNIAARLHNETRRPAT